MKETLKSGEVTGLLILAVCVPASGADLDRGHLAPRLAGIYRSSFPHTLILSPPSVCSAANNWSYYANGDYVKFENKLAAQRGRRVTVTLSSRLCSSVWWPLGSHVSSLGFCWASDFSLLQYQVKSQEKNSENVKVWCSCSSLKLSTVIMDPYIIYVYILCVHTDNICVGWCALVVTKEDVGVLTYDTLPHFLESGYLTEPRSR